MMEEKRCDSSAAWNSWGEHESPLCNTGHLVDCSSSPVISPLFCLLEFSSLRPSLSSMESSFAPLWQLQAFITAESSFSNNRYIQCHNLHLLKGNRDKPVQREMKIYLFIIYYNFT